MKVIKKSSMKDTSVINLNDYQYNKLEKICRNSFFSINSFMSSNNIKSVINNFYI